MKILADIHVHTVSSGHAYSTVDEIARFAASQGMEAVAITDHSAAMPGGAHLFHFANLHILPKYIHGVRIIRGAEVNIIDYDGTIDLEVAMMERLELVIASLHPPCIKGADKETITKTLMKVIENPHVDIIGHPGDDRFPMDFDIIAQHAKKHKVLLELNNSSLQPTGTRIGARKHIAKMLESCKKYETPIVVGSDSHYCEGVGDFAESIKLMKELNFPEYLIVNKSKDGLMDFIQRKGDSDES